MSRHSNILLFYLLPIILFVSCTKDSENEVSAEVSRTVMVYMSANNNLASEAIDNLNQMESGFSGAHGKLLVYAKIFGQRPRIYEVIHDTSDKIMSKVLKEYPEHNASDPSTMKMVFEDMESLGRARSYAAVLWSHATNWYPGNKKMAKVKSFGEDNGDTMDVKDLKKALPNNLSYLVFDACSMGSVEVLYELKDLVPYVLASPTEVISVGMPYDQIISHLFDENVERGLTNAGQVYFDFYNSKQGKMRSASFSLINMKEMQNLAVVMGSVINRQNGPRQVIRANVQRLDLDPFATQTVPAFDLLDFCEKNFSKADVEKVKKQLKETVLFKVSTTHFLGTPIEVFSGLSCYIPIESELDLNKYYQGLGWNQASSYSKLFHWMH
ncbi:clostripain-related cysteine peptidase [Sphingobacterium sp. WM]|uniref:clostripain-related cysteine peptidase n=1 Tax=Sphingobacterium sp. WM TaxID=3031802 RepID=UPI00240E581D|nr:clostripain-related cysteine peptidase [Sphingobacterium sp. WM]WFB64393.1 clostripain-related cysteine peptidase [Sphingobacterium sp. WM]